MSVYKPQKSPFFHYDFQLSGARFSGSTGKTSRREAEAFERTVKEQAKVDVNSSAANPKQHLTLGEAASRYWNEIGQHHAASGTTLTNLERLVNCLGPNKRVDQITDIDVVALVAWRRAQTVKGRTHIRDPIDPKKLTPAPRVSAATVNRSTIEPLQKIVHRAKTVWGVSLPNEPSWKKLFLKEPQDRVREVRADEEAAIENAIPEDYRAVVAFARESGLRLAECLLLKREVDLTAGRLETVGKGGRKVARPITTEMRRILMAEMANPTEHVFTYRAERTKSGKGGWKKGDARPITASGLKTTWRRARKSGLPADLRFHDMRHDFATKLLRETGNLKLVQRALGHSKIETTSRYAHVHDEEVAAGMEAASRSRKSRTKSRNSVLKPAKA